MLAVRTVFRVLIMMAVRIVIVSQICLFFVGVPHLVCIAWKNYMPKAQGNATRIRLCVWYLCHVLFCLHFCRIPRGWVHGTANPLFRITLMPDYLGKTLPLL